MRLEPRPRPSRVMAYTSPLIALALTVVLGTLLFIVLGKDPVAGLRMFFYEPVHNLYSLSELALKATPLILCAVGLSVCYRSNVWNIGAEGQLLAGAIAAGGLALYVTTSGANELGRWVVLPIMLCGVLGGMLWASITALLRDRFHANEILVSLMLVYVAQLLLSYLVFGPWKDPLGYNFPQTKVFARDTLLPIMAASSRLHVGFLAALATVGVVWVFMFRTYVGFQLQVGGMAPDAARYAGFAARRALWISMLVSGATAGLAGAMEVAGPLAQLTPHVSPGYGFSAIIVAFVGRLHPIGCIFAGFLLSMMLIGGELAQSRLGLPNALTGVFQGLLLITLLGCDTLIRYRIRRSS
jgi:ABC-type uncharacterized transport system permease subunit